MFFNKALKKWLCHNFTRQIQTRLALALLTGLILSQVSFLSNQVEAAAAATSSLDLPVPATIRVYRTYSGTIETIDFKTYVKRVLPNEWLLDWNPEALKAGAMAVKTFAWYEIRHPKYSGAYDVRDDTADQVYNPAAEDARTNAAVDIVWNWRMTQNNDVYQLQYCAGFEGDGNRADNQCGQPVGAYMSQWGSEYWAEQHKSWDWILRYYYDNLNLSNDNPATETVKTATTTPATPATATAATETGTRTWPILQSSNVGEPVVALQHLLLYRGYNLQADGTFGTDTQQAVQQFQTAYKLNPNGVVDKLTWEALVTPLKPDDKGEAVVALQRLLVSHNAILAIDGEFGAATSSALKAFQLIVSLPANGTAGLNTWCELLGGSVTN